VVSATDAAPFNSINVYWETVSAATLLGTTTAGAPPNQATPSSFNVTITIPTAINGAHNLIVTDGVTNQGYVLTVASRLTSSVTPSTGTTTRALPGDAVTLTGTGFAASSAILLTFNGNPIPPIGVTTNVNGSFTATIVIPVGTGLGATYPVVATDASANAGTATVFVGYYITVNPSGATAPVPPGVTVTISGRITPTTAYTISIDAVLVLSGTSDSNGRFSQTYVLQTLMGVGGHTVSITAAALVITPASLTTGVPPTATLSAASGVAGALITVTGAAFDASANVSISFGSTVVNNTATDSRFGPTNAAGALSAVFSVPSLTSGLYVVTVVDQYGATATVAGGFTINAAPVTTITTAPSYMQGDIISFTIKTTDPNVIATGVVVAIKDPTGAYQWGVVDVNKIPQAAALGSVVWTVTPDYVTATTGTVAVSAQVGAVGNQFLVLPSNAPIGIWNWTIAYIKTGESYPTLATGTFTVIVGGIGAITTQITSLGTKIDGVSTKLDGLNATIMSISGNVVTIKTSVGTIQTSVDSLSGKLTSISNQIASISSPDLGPITASLTSISAKIDSVSGTTATISSSVGSITTSLSSLNTAVTSVKGDVSTLQGNVATIKTDLGTLSGTITSVTGNIATIQTALGTIQADISGLKSSVSTVQTDISDAKSATDSLSPLIIVAIVLALIAAVAAIASIVLMRRKIAG